MSNFRDFTKICRVCMSDGSRDIFHKNTGPNLINNTNNEITSPLDRLLEKLRYVTMMKIEENDDLPRLLCDLCIVQLNVAYNFKRQAVENDTRLRQYFIENGISSNTTNIGINNNNGIFNDNSNPRSSSIVSNVSSIPTNRSFPIVPFVIKTEPSDNDALSDVMTEINLDTNRIERFTPSIHQRSTPASRETAGTSSDSGIDIFSKDKYNSSVVYINSYGYKNSTPSSDIESVHTNCQIQSNSSYTHTLSAMNSPIPDSRKQQKQQNSLEQSRQTIQKRTESANIDIISNLSNENQSKKIPATVITSPATSLIKENNITSLKSRHRQKRELKNLSINMSLATPKRRKTNEVTKKNKNQSAEVRKLVNVTVSSVYSNADEDKSLERKAIVKNDSNKKSKKFKSKNIQIPGKLQPSLSSTRTSNQSNVTSKTSVEHKLLINPYSNTVENNETKLRKRSLYNEGRVKEKVVTKLLRPKLEPTTK